MAPLRQSPKITRWNDSFAHSFFRADRLGGTASEWKLVGVGEVTKGLNSAYLIPLAMKRDDGMVGHKYLRSSDENFLTSLLPKLQKSIGKSWELLGDLEVV